MLCFLLSFLMAGTFYAYEGVTFGDEQVSEITMIQGDLYGFKQTTTWQYPYSDELFLLPSDEYHHTLAQASVGMATASFRDTEKEDAQDDNLIEFMEQAGFEDIDTETYRNEPTTDSISYGIAWKTIDDFTLLAVAVCGGNYSKEWASNLTVGDGVRSEGFNDAAQKVEAAVYDYMEAHGISGKTKIWICGYSRAGATSNIAAADFTDSGKFEDVYAYCFAAPRTTKEPGNYTNIFNILGKDDIVPKVPLADWGYKRYGIDLYTRSVEADSDSMEYLEKVEKTYYQLTGHEITVNPEINYQLRVIFDYLYMLLPDATTYKETFQPLLLDAMVNGNYGDALAILIETLTAYSDASEENQQELEELIEYVQTLANQYVLQGNTEQVSLGAWDSSLGMVNLFNEHLPYKYIARLFASEDPNEIFSENTAYTRLSISGKVSVQITNENGLVETIEKDGTVRDFYPEDYYECPDVSWSEDMVIITLPCDADWMVYVSSETVQMIGYSLSTSSNDTVTAELSPYYLQKMEADRLYQIHVVGGMTDIDQTLSDYDDAVNFTQENYSPTLAMEFETQNRRHITINEIVGFGLLIGIFVAFELVVSIVLAIIRVVRKKKRVGALTAIGHILNVVLFTVVELQLWYYVPVYPIVKTAAKIVVLLFLTLLLLKGLRKYHNKRNRILVPAIILAEIADVVLEHLLIGRLTGIKWIIPIAAYVIFIIAIWFVWHHPKQVHRRLSIKIEKREKAAKSEKKQDSEK